MRLTRRRRSARRGAPLGALRFPPRLRRVVAGPVRARHRRRERPRLGRRLAHAGRGRAAARFDLVGLRWARGAHSRPRCARAPRAGAGRAGPASGNHAGTATAPTPSSPAPPTSSSAVPRRGPQSQRPLSPRLPRSAPRARAARPVAAPAMIPRAAWARIRSAGNAPSYGTVQAAFVHHTSPRSTSNRRNSAGIGPRDARYHRDPTAGRTSVTTSSSTATASSSRSRRRHRSRRDRRQRRAEQLSTASVLGRYRTSRSTHRDGVARAADRLESSRCTAYPVQGQVSLISGGCREQPLPKRTPVLFERVAVTARLRDLLPRRVL